MVAIAFALESTGEAAYMGGVVALQNQVLKITAAVSTVHMPDCDTELSQTCKQSIQGVEARQSSFLSTLNGMAPWYGIFDTPLNQSQVISLAGTHLSSPSPRSLTDIPPSRLHRLMSG